jgi:Arc-like DNA binding domain
MRRKPNETVQVNLRIKEELRRKLEAAAKEHEVSFNQEIRARLEESLERKAKQSIESVASDIERNWHRFRDLFLVTSVNSTMEETLKILEAMLENTKEDPELSALVQAGQAWLKTKSPQKGGNA